MNERIKTSSDYIGENGLPIEGTTIKDVSNALKASEGGYLQDAVYSGVLVNEMARTNKRAEVIKALVNDGHNKGTLSVYSRLANLHKQVGLTCIINNLQTYKTATRTASLWGAKALANNAPALRKVLVRINESDLSKDELNAIREDFGLPVREEKEPEKTVETTIDSKYVEDTVAKMIAAGFLKLVIETVEKAGKVEILNNKPSLLPSIVQKEKQRKAA